MHCLNDIKKTEHDSMVPDFAILYHDLPRNVKRPTRTQHELRARAFTSIPNPAVHKRSPRINEEIPASHQSFLLPPASHYSTNIQSTLQPNNLVHKNNQL